MQVQLHIFSMLEGDSGNKPGFKMLKEASGAGQGGVGISGDGWVKLGFAFLAFL